MSAHAWHDNPCYLEGRAAFARGVGKSECPYRKWVEFGHEDWGKHWPWRWGWHDAATDDQLELAL